MTPVSNAVISLDWTAGWNGGMVDRVLISASFVDLDIDSLNNNTIGSAASDAVEANMTAGKWVAANTRDSDGDGVPDYADGIDRTLGGANPVNNKAPSGGQFTLVQLELPTLIDPAVATIEFDYAVANPNSITKGSGPYDYAPGSGTMTLWTDGIVDGFTSYARKPNLVSYAIMPGHFIPDSTEFPVNRLGAAAGSRISLWLEGISPSASAGATSIVVLLDPDGAGPLPDVVDSVRLTVFDVDVSIDSDNTAGFRGGPNGPNPHEDNIEELNDAPGKHIPLNHGDLDADGWKDYWDGYSVPGWNQAAANVSANFTPIEVTIPNAVNLATAMIRIDYPVNDPSLSGLEDVRIWTKDGDEARDGLGVDDGGDWVESVYYSPAQLGFTSMNRTVTLYVEGVGRSTATDYITVSLNPDNALLAPDEATDRAAFTTFYRGITGQIQYDPTAPKAVRSATVVLVSGSSLPALARTRTDDHGYFFLEVGPDELAQPNLQVEVWASSYPYGTTGSDPLRSVYVTPVASGDAYDFDITSFVTWPTVTTPISSVGTRVIGNPTGAHTNAQKAFWTFDAAVTAARFHAHLPGASAGETRLVYPDTGGTFYTPATGIISIGNTVEAGDVFDDWDTIIHEYGHRVADLHSIDVDYDLANNTHYWGFNLRGYYPTEDVHELAALSASEGFANFYSVLAQEVEGVSNPPVIATRNTGHVAGDLSYKVHSLETQGGVSAGMGEDDEASVARILWDLYDPANEPTDEVELSIPRLFGLLPDHTSRLLWQDLETDAAGDNRQIIRYGNIFQSHNVAAQPVGLLIGGMPSNTWNRGTGSNPPPTFEWDIPQGSLARGGSPSIGANVGDVFDHFGIKIFDANHNEVFDSGLLDDTEWTGVPTTARAHWTPSAAQWSGMSSINGTYRWIVYAAWWPDYNEPSTGFYWSHEDSLIIAP